VRPAGPTEATPVLRVTDLRVTFAPGSAGSGAVHAVNGLSLRLAAGEVLALVGESGCGKSLTALSVLGLTPPAARVRGRIEVDGRDLVGLPGRELRAVRGRRVAMVFQEPMSSLNPGFTVGWQLVEALRRHQRISRRRARQRAVELLESVRIGDAARRLRDYPHQLSGGMRQRVMLAMALACEPAVLIADEPTTALDVTIQAQVLEILREATRRTGLAVLLITHDLGVVARIADRVAVMYAGCVVESAATTALFAAPQHPYTIGLLGAVPDPRWRRMAGPSDARPRRLAEIPGTVPVLRAPPDRCVFVDRCARASESCRAAPPLLRQRPDVPSANLTHLVACVHPGRAARPAPSGSGG
jgi:peptide/nickel transport system ATP-binding protein